MEPIFPKWTNKVPLMLIVGLCAFATLLCTFIWYYFSPKFTAVGYQPTQPIPFSHALHAGQLGVDCRYCHSTVEKSSFAALPTTSVCMGCHNKVVPKSNQLKALRESVEKKTPIPWVQIHKLPRHVHFDHNAHVLAGVGCVSCHGRIDKMDTVYQAQPLNMGWCLECHRNPLPNLRPKDQVTNMLYDPITAHFDPLVDPKTGIKRIVQPPEACGACHY